MFILLVVVVVVVVIIIIVIIIIIIIIIIVGCNGIPHAVNTTFGYLDGYHNTGFVRSPHHRDNNYPNNLVCRWSIRVAPGFLIKVTVQQADLSHAAQPGGLGDTLLVSDGVSYKTSHQNMVPWEFLSTKNLVRVVFTSDSANSGRGFYLQYERGIFTETSYASIKRVLILLSFIPPFICVSVNLFILFPFSDRHKLVQSHITRWSYYGLRIMNEIYKVTTGDPIFRHFCLVSLFNFERCIH